MSWLEQLSKDYIVRETQIREWIQTVLDIKFKSADLSEVLRSGNYLCELMLRLDPKSIPKVHEEGSSQYKLRENVEFFIQAAIEYGVPRNCCFRALDLIKKQNMNLVMTSLIKLSDIAEERQFPILLPTIESIKPPTINALTPTHQRIIKNLGKLRGGKRTTTTGDVNRIVPIVPPRSM